MDIGDNISDDTSCGFSGTGDMGQKLGDGVNPLLDPKGLQANGGPTETIALQASSPAVHAIPFASCTDQATPPHQLKNDQRGKPRPDPADGPTGPCDVGAYEFQTPGPLSRPSPKSFW
ncbi:MAG: choice-of-anchor Q domain-containing protein [Candidatus Binataceae bacterium]